MRICIKKKNPDKAESININGKTIPNNIEQIPKKQ